MSTPIAPVTAIVFTDPSNPDKAVECFNARLSGPELEKLTTPYPDIQPPMFPMLTAMMGLFPLLVCGMHAFGWAVNLTSEVFPDLIMPFVFPGIGVTLASLLWISYVMSPKRPRPKAWRDSLSAAWLKHSGGVYLFGDIPKDVNEEVWNDAITLDSIGRGLNRLDPRGDELDGARAALVSYIAASRIPLLDKRAAEAPHIKDPAVRKAAKDYKRAVEKQADARRFLDGKIAGARELLAARRQERTDAELIRLANER
ncbi:hypothetical protein [Pseudarthrobacter sp. BIM B-2242]|uniref:hypothetical protein n=1 Tax=Pseudarthrobacter sp. BIM B-2242 TaxID=2772401 RepID=UPI00168A87D8|nr:hypothetical protein [Pseudarthrobacter sp. BIM B-2242]QOD06034.1 hypothetical protein IDT60_20940 [Pseudarthrobacter sp. BIM B-2242]